jgi:hypothetical protein
MKIKLLICIISAVLLVLFLLIDLTSADNSATDKWTSFGLGMMAPIFISSIIATVIHYRKQKAL